MNSIDKAVATQLANIEKRTGQSLADLARIVAASGLAKHGELVTMLRRGGLAGSPVARWQGGGWPPGSGRPSRRFEQPRPRLTAEQ
jgi:hypothetical protein